ncbi:hypothetical protein BHE74_00045732 [Ensete ventricosum]|nr:hypothetical protein BHE74_00045732 [Ensete ventricosum]
MFHCPATSPAPYPLPLAAIARSSTTVVSPPIAASHYLPLFPVAAVPSLLVVGISSKKGTPPLVLSH